MLWTIIVTVLCLVDLSKVNTQNSISIPNLDKIVHLVFYTLMTFLWGISLLKPSSSIFPKSVALIASCIIFGIIIEILQGFGGFNRSFEWKDILANTTGVFLGYIICLKILKFKPHIK